MGNEYRDEDPTPIEAEASISAYDPTETLAGPGPPSDRGQESPKALDRGEMLGRYVVLDYLGGGGMGVVYTAYDPNLDRKVAVKLLRAEVMSHRAFEARKRLVQEARALARLAHPNVVAVHDIGAVRNQIFLAMEHVEGRDLRIWLREEKTTWQRVLEVFVQAGEGLAAAHRAGLLHRDFKPANVILGEDGRARVLDFGLAAQARRAPLESDPSMASPSQASPGGDQDDETPADTSAAGTPATGDSPGSDDGIDPSSGSLSSGGDPTLTQEVRETADSGGTPSSKDASPGASERPSDPPSDLPGTGAPLGQLTEPGSRVGTPAYMSPEQLRGQRIDARSDQFGFCVALYEALFRRSPFENRYARPLIGDRAEKILSPPKDSEVPTAIANVVMRGLAFDPDDRFPDMEALLEALKPEVKKRSARLYVLFAVALVMVTVGLFQLRGTPPCLDMGQHWVGVWDDARRAEVRRRFAESTFPWAAELRIAIERQLDAYTANWTTMRTESCEATRVRGDQSENLLDLRSRCLDQRLFEVEAVVDLLAQADEEIVRNAGSALSGLRTLDRCADTETLLAIVPPPDPAIRDRAEAVRKAIAEAEALYNLRQVERAYDSTRTLKQSIEGLSYAPVEAEALQIIGLAAELSERATEAREAMIDAARTADAGHHDEIRLRALLGLVSLDQKSPDVAQTWLAMAKGVAERLDSPYFDSLWLQRRSELLKSEGNFPAALGAARQAVTQLRNPAGPDHRNIAFLLTTLADMLYRLHESEEALAVITEALPLQQERLGPTHPDVAFVESLHGLILGQLGRHEEALEIFERIEPVFLEAYGPEHPRTAYLLHGLGSTRNRLGLTEGALEALERSAAIYSKLEGHGLRAAGIYNSLALVYWQEGRLDEAEDRLRRAVDSYQLKGTPDHPNALIYRTNLGRVILDRDRPGPAASILEPTYRAARETLGPDHVTTLHSGLGLGTAWLRLGQVERGGALVETVAEGAEAIDARDWLVGLIRFSQARLARARGNAAEEEAFAEQARAIFERMGRSGAFDLATMEAWVEEAPRR